jgi:hypothetical protein
MPTPTAGRNVRLGRTVTTPRILESLNDKTIFSLLERHSRGDWGDLEPEDWELNEQVMDDPEHDGRLFSSYKNVPASYDPRESIKVWIITDAPETPDAITTVLLPDEY